MISEEKKRELLSNFLSSYYKLITCGIEFDESKCDNTKIFFTYPENVSELCLQINYEKIDDGTFKDAISSLIESPKDTCVDVVKKFMVYISALGLADNAETEDFEIDGWFEDIEYSRSLIPIKLFAKPRKGTVWTKQAAEEQINAVSNRIDKNIDKLKSEFAGYAEV